MIPGRKAALLLVLLGIGAPLMRAQGLITTVVGTGTIGFSGDGGPATSALLNFPAGVAVDSAGNLFIADTGNGRIRKVAPAGTISTVAGGGVLLEDGIPATDAGLSISVLSVAADTVGNIYIADNTNYRVRKVSAAGIITTVAGNGQMGFSGDGNPARFASMSFVTCVAVDNSGNIYVCDYGNNRIRQVNEFGIISTVAGNGTAAFSGDGGPATSASLNGPSGLAVDAVGNLYISDAGNQRIRKVNPNGVISTVAGNGTAGSSGDGGPATSASLNSPRGLAADAAGNLYIADDLNHRVRKVATSGVIQTVAGLGTAGFGGDGGLSNTTTLNRPHGVAIDKTGLLYIADRFNNRIRRVQPTPQIVFQPSALTFTAVAGGTNPPAQTVNVTNAVGGTANWVSAASTLSGGSWLFAQPGSGSTPGTITVTVRVGSLSPGTYRGTVTVGSLQALFPSVTLGVTLTVTPAPVIALSAAALSFTAQAGGANPASQTVNISNSGGSTLNWTANVTTGAWLSVNPASGTGAGTLTVSANIAGLAAGTHAGSIAVAATGATNTPQTISVTLTLTAAPVSVISLSLSSLQFVGNVGANPAPQTFQVQNTGAGVLNWTAAVSTQSGGNWLAVSPTSGTASSTVTVTVTSASLAAGLYTGSITISAQAASNASNSPQVVAVTLALGVPVVGQDGVVNGASFSKDAVVSPGGIASLFGVNLTAAESPVFASSLPLPTTLGATQVLVKVADNEVAAPLFYVSRLQINFQMPAETTGANVSVVVLSGGLRGLAATVKTAGQVPGIFATNSAGTGQGAVLNQDFSPNSPQNPATAGSVLQIFATGLGATDPPLASGLPGNSSEPFHRTVVPPVVLVGGVSSEVLFSAVAPGFVGLYQVNARVPSGTTPGNAVTLQIQLGGRSSNTVTIAVH